MPLYEYQCDACSHRFERIQKFSDPPVEVCPSCGGRVQKLLSSPAIQFKGSGWYITDYARKSSGKDGKDGKDGKGAAGDKKGSDAAPAASSSSDSAASGGSGGSGSSGTGSTSPGGSASNSGS